MENKPDLDFPQKVDVAKRCIAARLSITPEQVAVALGECTSPDFALAAAAKDHCAYATDSDQEARSAFGRPWIRATGWCPDSSRRRAWPIVYEKCDPVCMVADFEGGD